MSDPQFVAIIPAAGLSRRMGRPKLLLPWRGTTVIGHLIGELSAAGIQTILVVSRSGDHVLHDAVNAAGAISVLPLNDPPDMRTSVEYGLRSAIEHSESRFGGWLLIPADHPIVSRETIDSLRRSWSPHGERQILIPTYQGKRGHPTVFSRDLASEVDQIPPDCGLNWLVRQNANCIREVPVPDPGVTMDLDTPDDYEQLMAELGV